MRRLLLPLALACAVALAGCAHTNADGTTTGGFVGALENIGNWFSEGKATNAEFNAWAATGKTATAVFNVALAYAKTAPCDAVCARTLSNYVHQARAELDKWKAALDAGDSGAIQVAIDLFDKAMGNLKTELHNRGVQTP